MINNQIKFPIIVNSSNYNFIQNGGEDIIELNKKLVIDYNKLKGIILNTLKDDYNVNKIIIDILGLVLSKTKNNFNIYDVNNNQYLYKNDSNKNIINIYYDKINNIYYPWKLDSKTNPSIETNIFTKDKGSQIIINDNKSLSFYYTITSYINININIGLVNKFKNDIYNLIIDKTYINNSEWNSLIDKYINDIKNNKHIDNQNYYIGDKTHPIYIYLNDINKRLNITLTDINDYTDITKLINDLDIKEDIEKYIKNNNEIIDKINKKFNGIFYYSNQLVYKFNQMKNTSISDRSKKGIKFFNENKFNNFDYKIIYYRDDNTNINIKDENNINIDKRFVNYDKERLYFYDGIVKSNILDSDYDKLIWLYNTLYIKI